MSYKYITDNNLYNKQTYMYTEYEGKQFLKDYLKSRSIVKKIEKFTDSEEGIRKESAVHQDLRRIYLGVKNGDRNAVNRLKAYVKTFEVRKRLYTEYSEWKPEENAVFEEYDAYLVFSDCLLEAYKKTKCLKYYSCLLKVDDTLLSIQSLLSDLERAHLSTIISEELEIFQTLSEKYGIVLEE